MANLLSALRKNFLSIKTASRQTGISPNLLRAWENRYRAVCPSRTPTNRRIYSHEQIERLKLLRQATEGGHTISLVAGLSDRELRGLVEAICPPSNGLRTGGEPVDAAALVKECLAAMKSLDEPALQSTLHRAESVIGTIGLFQQVIMPFQQAVGEGWARGTINVGEERFATEVLKQFLARTTSPYGGTANSPVLLVATPAGQHHVLGALLVRAVALTQGWRVMYLGVSVPTPDLVITARQCGARAVALSLIYPEDDPSLPGELLRLRELLPPDVAVIVGGRAAPAYAKVIKEIQADHCDTLSELVTHLQQLRKPVGMKAARPVRVKKDADRNQATLPV